MPNVGLMRVADAENGTERWVDTGSKHVRQAFDRWWYKRQLNMSDTLRRSRVDLASIATDEDYVKALMGMFKRRVVTH